MKIGLSTLNKRISPLLDTAQYLSVYDINGASATLTEEYLLCGLSITERSAFFRDAGINILICGAVSRPLCKAILSSNINLIAWISGDIEEILQAYINNSLSDISFAMPGCCGLKKRHGFRRTSIRKGKR